MRDDISSAILYLLLGMMLAGIVADSRRHREVLDRLDRIERWMKAPSGSVGR